MCGIAGIFELQAAAGPRAADRLDARLKRMADALRHRGPDDEGYFVAPAQACGIAFRRLAIIDLATGQQPVRHPELPIALAFNGEIYNFLDLRAMLSGLGCVFRTNGDAEVILHAYATWGAACFRQLKGMFAIAIWDGRTRELLLARDRFGKKPLYVHQTADAVYFASELKAFRALPDLPRRIQPQVLHDYLLTQYVPHGDLIVGEQSLTPGEVQHWSAGANAPLRTRFYPPPEPELTRLSYAEAREHLGVLLERSVERRLISDVPLGAFLSGGIDSSIVVGLMRRLGVAPLRTFSIGFDDPRFDEAAHARRVAQHFGAEHHEQVVTAERVRDLARLADIYDEPFGDSSAIPTVLLAQFARRSVTVALTGDAGDECFGGYDRYRAAVLSHRLDRTPLWLRREAGRLAEFVPHGRAKSASRRAYRFLRTLGQAPPARYAEWVSVFTPESLAEGYRPEFAERIDLSGYFGTIEQCFSAGAARRDVGYAAAWTDLQTYLPADLLTKVDRASMACGLECRSPFLDPEVVEFAFSLPTAWKLDGQHGKKILKDWARPLLPAEILDRPKMGFGVPVGEWFRGPLEQSLRDWLFDPKSISRRIFRADWLAELVDQHVRAQADHAHRLWTLVMLELWAARWAPTFE